MLDPAKTVIEICGGPKVVAEMVGRSANRVRRWAYPRSKFGMGGLIPTEMQPILLSEARKRGINLRAEHLIPKT